MPGRAPSSPSTRRSSPDTAVRAGRAAAAARVFTSSTRRSAAVAARPRRVSWRSWSVRPTKRSSLFRAVVQAVGFAGRARRRAGCRHANEAGAQHVALHLFRRRMRGAEARRGGWYRPAGAGQRVVRHSDAQTGGAGMIMFRDDTKPLSPDHFLYDRSCIPAGSARRTSGWRWRSAMSSDVDLPLARDGAARTWPPGSASRTASTKE